MTGYLCRPDGPGWEWTVVRAADARRAAEVFAERRDAAAVEYPPSRDVRVRGPGGSECVFVVELESVPVYRARRKREGPA